MNKDFLYPIEFRYWFDSLMMKEAREEYMKESLKIALETCHLDLERDRWILPLSLARLTN